MKWFVAIGLACGFTVNIGSIFRLTAAVFGDLVARAAVTLFGILGPAAVVLNSILVLAASALGSTVIAAVVLLYVLRLATAATLDDILVDICDVAAVAVRQILSIPLTPRGGRGPTASGTAGHEEGRTEQSINIR